MALLLPVSQEVLLAGSPWARRSRRVQIMDRHPATDTQIMDPHPPTDTPIIAIGHVVALIGTLIEAFGYALACGCVIRT
jgi:hypothetical protein